MVYSNVLYSMPESTTHAAAKKLADILVPMIFKVLVIVLLAWLISYVWKLIFPSGKDSAEKKEFEWNEDWVAKINGVDVSSSTSSKDLFNLLKRLDTQDELSLSNGVASIYVEKNQNGNFGIGVAHVEENDNKRSSFKDEVRLEDAIDVITTLLDG